MSEEIETAKKYLVHAEGLRILADSMQNRDYRQILLGLAENYERLAESLEAIDKTNKTLAKHEEPK